MEKIKILSLIILFQFTYSQDSNFTDFNSLLEREEIFYSQGDSLPFSGNVAVKDSLDNLLLKGEILDGKSNGKWTIFFPNGTIRATFNIQDGQLNGEFKEYDLNGKLSKEGVFSDGSMDKIWSLYNLNGELLFSLEYEDGKVKY